MWSHGELIVRREVLGLSPIGAAEPKVSPERVWLELPVYVVEDTDEHLVTYTASGAELGFPDGDWPTDDGLHPWHGRRHWEGHGCLMVQRPGEHHAVWHFWDGPDREFRCWYINLQSAFRRTENGYDTQDLEVDFVVMPDGAWTLKDYEALGDRVAEGRFSPELADWIRDVTVELTAKLDSRAHWWDPRWAAWTPPDSWRDPRLSAARRRP